MTVRVPLSGNVPVRRIRWNTYRIGSGVFFIPSLTQENATLCYRVYRALGETEIPLRYEVASTYLNLRYKSYSARISVTNNKVCVNIKQYRLDGLGRLFTKELCQAAIEDSQLPYLIKKYFD